MRRTQYSSSMLRGKVSTSMSYFFMIICLVSVVCFIGGLLSGGHVYGRFKSGTCRVPGGIFARTIPASDICCNYDSYHADNWVCLAAFDNIERFLTQFAWVAPLIPTLIAFFMDLAWRRSVVTSHLRKIGVFLMAFGYRTLILYLFFGAIQNYASKSQTVENCWYFSLLGRYVLPMRKLSKQN